MVAVRMDSVSLLLLAAAFIVFALLLGVRRRARRPTVLSPEDAGRALAVVLSATPHTAPWVGPADAVARGASGRIEDYVHPRLTESSDTRPDAHAAPGGVSGWYELDRQTLNDARARTMAHVVAALEVTADEHAPLIGNADVFAGWRPLAAFDAGLAGGLHELPELRALGVAAATADEPAQASPEHRRSAAPNPDVPIELRNRIDALVTEALVLADQTDSYVSKAATDDGWRAVVREAVTLVRHTADAPAALRLREWLSRTTLQIKDALNNPVLDALVDELGVLRSRVATTLSSSDFVREFLVDPRMLEAAQQSAAAARVAAQHMESRLHAEREQLLSQWQEQLIRSGDEAMQHQQRCAAAADAVVSAVEQELKIRVTLDESAASRLLKQAEELLGNARHGTRKRLHQEWEARAASATSGASPEAVLRCVIAVPGGQALVEGLLANQVQIRGAALLAADRALATVRIAAEQQADVIMQELASTATRLQDAARVGVESLEADVRRTLHELREYVEQLERWAVRGPEESL